MATELEQDRQNRANWILKQINLALGNAAFLNVGMVHGTVAAGDDVRFNGLLTSIPGGALYIISTDPRLTNNRFPTPHASTHYLGAVDWIDPVLQQAVAAPPRGLLCIDTGQLVFNIDAVDQVIVGP